MTMTVTQLREGNTDVVGSFQGEADANDDDDDEDVFVTGESGEDGKLEVDLIEGRQKGE